MVWTVREKRVVSMLASLISLNFVILIKQLTTLIMVCIMLTRLH